MLFQKALKAPCFPGRVPKAGSKKHRCGHYAVTQDKEWLREKGWPILSSTADFWVSRVERNGPGKYDIKNVVAADEWAENVDNNAFTNAAAKANLNYAIAAAKILGINANPDWSLVAQHIPILKMENGV